MLIMPSTLEHNILGMNILCAMDTTMRYGSSQLVLETRPEMPALGEGPKKGLPLQRKGVRAWQPNEENSEKEGARAPLGVRQNPRRSQKVAGWTAAVLVIGLVGRKYARTRSGVHRGIRKAE